MVAASAACPVVAVYTGIKGNPKYSAQLDVMSGIPLNCQHAKRHILTILTRMFQENYCTIANSPSSCDCPLNIRSTV